MRLTCAYVPAAVKLNGQKQEYGNHQVVEGENFRLNGVLTEREGARQSESV
jgi:hypothetical protein